MFDIRGSYCRVIQSGCIKFIKFKFIKKILIDGLLLLNVDVFYSFFFGDLILFGIFLSILLSFLVEFCNFVFEEDQMENGIFLID